MGAAYWARQANLPFEQDNLIPTEQSHLWRCVAIASKSTADSPRLIFVDGRRLNLVDRGPFLRSFLETGFACNYLSLQIKSVDDVQTQLPVILRRITQFGSHADAVVVIAESSKVATMLVSAFRAGRIRPDLLICVSDENGFDRIYDEVTKNDQPLEFPIVIAAKGTSDSLRNAKARLITSKPASARVEFVAFENASDAHKGDLLFHKELAEKARVFLFRAGKLKAAAPPARARIVPGWHYATMPAMCFLAALGLSVWQKIRDLGKTPVSRRIAVTAILIGGIAVGAGTAAALDESGVIAPLLRFRTQNTLDRNILKYVEAWYLSGTNIRQVRDYITLADYNRQIVKWRLDTGFYTQYVLSPGLSHETKATLEWRLPLWKYFYPLIRRTTSSSDAAKIVVEELRLQIQILNLADNADQTTRAPRTIEDIWQSRAASLREFELIYTAALRSVGIAARMNHQCQVEIWDVGEWKVAPRPGALVTL